MSEPAVERLRANGVAAVLDQVAAEVWPNREPDSQGLSLEAHERASRALINGMQLLIQAVKAAERREP